MDVLSQIEGISDFERFKLDVNRVIPGLTKSWWDRVEVHLHGGIYRSRYLPGIIENEGEEDVSKIVTLLAIIGYAYLNVDWDEGEKLHYSIDAIHNKFLPDFFRLPLHDGLFNRRMFIDFINILLKHAQQTELYLSTHYVQMEGTALKRQGSNPWRVDVKDSKGNVKWVPKEGVAENQGMMQIPGFSLKVWENPRSILTAVAGPISPGYGDIVESVKILSEKQMFFHLIFLLKELVTKAYQLDSSILDYKVLDYRVALKVVEEEINEEIRDKYVNKLVRPGVWLLSYDGFEKVKYVFENILDGRTAQSPSSEMFDHWEKNISCGEDKCEIVVKESLLDMVKEHKLPSSYHAKYTLILITHLILYEKQENSRKNIYLKVAENFRNFRNLDRDVIYEEYQEIVTLISELWPVMYAWHNLYGRIYKNHILELSVPRFEREHIRFDQKMNTTELALWTQYLYLRFQTIQYKDDLDLSPAPNTFKKIFARVELLQKKLEPSFSNPPLIVIPHLHEDLDGAIAERLENFISNDELIYENEKEYINKLKDVYSSESEIQSLSEQLFFRKELDELRKGLQKMKLSELRKRAKQEGVDQEKIDQADDAGWPEIDQPPPEDIKSAIIDMIIELRRAELMRASEMAEGKLRRAELEHKEKEKSVGVLLNQLTEMINSPDILNLIRYYEKLIKDDMVGEDQIPFVREFKEKYKGDVSSLYDFIEVENKMLQEENMKEILKKEGNIERLLFVNDGIKDSKDEIVPETEYADIWPERKRYLDNALKEEEKDEVDLSDLMKESQGYYPAQNNWIQGMDARTLENPMKGLQDAFNKVRINQYSTATHQGQRAQEASQAAKRIHSIGKGKVT